MSRMIRVLGPVDVVTAVGTHSVGGRRPQMILAALALTVGHCTTVDHLVDVLWPSGPPDHAVSTIQSYVSRLRHLLGKDAIRSVDGSYLLDIDVEGLDALKFERLVRAARGEADPAAVRALCPWRSGAESRLEPRRGRTPSARKLSASTNSGCWRWSSRWKRNSHSGDQTWSWGSWRPSCRKTRIGSGSGTCSSTPSPATAAGSRH